MAKWPKVKESSLNSKAKHTMQKPTRKGVAKVTIKKKVLRKLKAGKKVTYTAKYSKKASKKLLKLKYKDQTPYFSYFFKTKGVEKPPLKMEKKIQVYTL